MKPFWITFYSYKGGVGRSLALANIAALLVKRGRRVALIDFDLEAPGLDSFEEFRCIASKPGVVEYVTRFKEIQRAPDIEQFVHPCELPGPLRGKLWIMPAGKKDPLYNVSRASLNWADLYENYHGEHFVENWKAAIARHYAPDYVLVDSRTGLTDVGGICTLHLPDLVVMLFGLNEQNVRGVAAVAKTIRESKITRLPQIHYVASPVPNLPREDKSPFSERWTTATSHLGVKIESMIRYNPLAALNEKLFVLERTTPSSSIVDDYKQLLAELITYNRSGFDFLEAQTQVAIAASDTSLMERLLAVLAKEFPARPESLLAQAQLKKALGDPQGADELATQALAAEPDYDAAVNWLLTSAKRRKDYKMALALSAAALGHSTQLPPEKLYDLNQEHACLAMTAGEFPAAAEGFKFCLNHAKNKKKHGDPDPVAMMVHFFNLTEARRRAGEQVDPASWQIILDLFEKTAATEAPLVYQANRWQARHIPLAIIGQLEKSREALVKARHAAELLGPAEDIFSVRTYTEVSVPEFLQFNDEMLAALDRGHLWDGMPLPPPADRAPETKPDDLGASAKAPPDPSASPTPFPRYYGDERDFKL
jgi:MinD-like ATPase involved in chromosome partitioning or flagellar assembly